LTKFQNSFTVGISNNLQQNCGDYVLPHLNVFFNYGILQNLTCSHNIVFDYSGHKHRASKSDFSYLN